MLEPNRLVAPPKFTAGAAACNGKAVSEAFHMLTHKACSADVLFGYLARQRLSLVEVKLG